MPEALRTLVGVARLAAKAGDEGRAGTLPALVLQHAGAPYDVHVDARYAARVWELDVTCGRAGTGRAQNADAVCEVGRTALRHATPPGPA